MFGVIVRLVGTIAGVFAFKKGGIVYGSTRGV